MTRTEVIQALKEAGLRPLKSLGQNFLIEEGLCRHIASQISAPPDDYWVEIGPGLGALTRELLKMGAGVTAIELDGGLCRWLTRHFEGQERFRLIEGDAVEQIAAIPVIHVAAGNLPYNVSTPVLMELLKREPLPSQLVFTLQKETGERFAAAPRTKAYGAVSVLLQACYHVECRRTLPGDVFYPEPNVQSIVFRAERRESLPDANERTAFYALLRRAFAQRRKKLRNTIEVDSDRRPEDLTVREWLCLFRGLS